MSQEIKPCKNAGLLLGQPGFRFKDRPFDHDIRPTDVERMLTAMAGPTDATRKFQEDTARLKAIELFTLANKHADLFRGGNPTEAWKGVCRDFTPSVSLDVPLGADEIQIIAECYLKARVEEEATDLIKEADLFAGVYEEAKKLSRTPSPVQEQQLPVRPEEPVAAMTDALGDVTLHQATAPSKTTKTTDTPWPPSWLTRHERRFVQNALVRESVMGITPKNQQLSAPPLRWANPMDILMYLSQVLLCYKTEASTFTKFPSPVAYHASIERSKGYHKYINRLRLGTISCGMIEELDVHATDAFEKYGCNVVLGLAMDWDQGMATVLLMRKLGGPEEPNEGIQALLMEPLGRPGWQAKYSTTVLRHGFANFIRRFEGVTELWRGGAGLREELYTTDVVEAAAKLMGRIVSDGGQTDFAFILGPQRNKNLESKGFARAPPYSKDNPYAGQSETGSSW